MDYNLLIVTLTSIIFFFRSVEYFVEWIQNGGSAGSFSFLCGVMCAVFSVIMFKVI